MKCNECFKILKKFYFNIGGMKLCLNCSRELIEDIWDFKVSLNQKGGKI